MNCSICGHPVYEWQTHIRKYRTAARTSLDDIAVAGKQRAVEPVDGWLFTHLNIWDCKPTEEPSEADN